MYFEKVNVIDKPLARLTKKKREDPNKIRNERGEITTSTTEIQKYHKRILQTVICQQIGQPRRYGQIFRDIQPAKTKSRRNAIGTDQSLAVKLNL